MSNEIKHYLIHAKEHMEDAEARCKNRILKRKIRALISHIEDLTEGEK